MYHILLLSNVSLGPGQMSLQNILPSSHHTRFPRMLAELVQVVEGEFGDIPKRPSLEFITV